MSPYNWAVATLPLALRDNGLPTCTASGGDIGCTPPNITEFTDGFNSLSPAAQAGIIFGGGAGGALLLGVITFLICRRCLRKSQGEMTLFRSPLRSNLYNTEPFPRIVTIQITADCHDNPHRAGREWKYPATSRSQARLRILEGQAH